MQYKETSTCKGKRNIITVSTENETSASSAPLAFLLPPHNFPGKIPSLENAPTFTSVQYSLFVKNEKYYWRVFLAGDTYFNEACLWGTCKEAIHFRFSAGGLSR